MPAYQSGFVRDALGHKSLESFFAEDVSSPSTHIALANVRLELAAKVPGLAGVVRLQHVSEVLYDGIGVVVSFEEPIAFIPEIIK